jgi:hypothetical protein
MISIKELNELAVEVHKNAVEHGWWEEKRRFAEVVDLIHCELSEAMEEYRNGHGIDEIYYACTTTPQCKPNYESGECKNNKPEGIPIELADTVIRILDYLDQKEREIVSGMGLIKFEGDFCDLIAECHMWISQAYTYRGFMKQYKKLLKCIEIIFSYCESNGIDIEKAIRIKHEYNKSRPYKHGGKVI